MLTANALPEHRAAGADAHLTKPITAPVLLGTVEQALSGGVMSCEGGGLGCPAKSQDEAKPTELATPR